MSDASSWQAALDALDPDELLPLGVTVREWVDLHGVRPPPEGVEFVENVPYGTAGRAGRDLLLHLFRPIDVSERRPAVVFVHGGGWAGGHPFMHLRHAYDLAAGGYTTAMITYRLAPEAKWPAALEDAKCAVRFLRADHASHGVDPGRIAVAGGSAGGHLACLVALCPGRFEGDGGHSGVPSSVGAVVTWYPITDMHAPGADTEHVRPIVQDFLGSLDDGAVDEASPINHVRRGAPPMLTMTGDVDSTAPLGMIREFHAALDDHGVANRLEVFEGRSHAFDFHPDDWRRCFTLLQGWLDTHLGPAVPVA